MGGVAQNAVGRLNHTAIDTGIVAGLFHQTIIRLINLLFGRVWRNPQDLIVVQLTAPPATH